jgi:hypothetical protein
MPFDVHKVLGNCPTLFLDFLMSFLLIKCATSISKIEEHIYVDD